MAVKTHVGKEEQHVTLSLPAEKRCKNESCKTILIGNLNCTTNSGWCDNCFGNEILSITNWFKEPGNDISQVNL